MVTKRVDYGSHEKMYVKATWDKITPYICGTLLTFLERALYSEISVSLRQM